MGAWFDKVLRPCRQMLGGLALALLALGGCSTVRPDLGQMSQAYSLAVEEHDRNSLLLNMVRAAYGLPMHFTTIATMMGQGTLSGSASLSSLVSPFAEGKLTTELQTSRRFDFTLSSLDNQQFTRNFLSDVPLGDVHVLDSSGLIPRELLYMLLLSRVSFDRLASDGQDYRNFPTAQGYTEFRGLVVDLIGAGFRTESFRRPMEIGPVLTRDEAVRFVGDSVRNLHNLVNLPEDDWFSLSPVAGTPGSFQVVVRDRRTRFCLLSTLRAKFARANLPASTECRIDIFDDPRSGSPNWSIRLEVDIRSTRDVLRYLGALVRAQNAAGADNWKATLNVASVPGGPREEQPLLVVRRGPVPDGVRVIAEASHLGENYYVPLEGSGLSAQVFEMLSLLMAMNKVPGSIPASSGVLVR